MKGNVPHYSRKVLDTSFDSLWYKLKEAGEQYLVTPRGHKFTAIATKGLKGTHGKQNLIQIKHAGKEFARIYPCCWGHTTNCYGTRIGGYSSGLDSWFKGLMISIESLTLKPKNEVINDFNKLLSSPIIDFNQALKIAPEQPGVYLVYDKKQRKYIYAGKANAINKRFRQHLRQQHNNSYFRHQQIQMGLIAQKRCHNSNEAIQYIMSNCLTRYLVIENERERKFPWLRRTLLEHYAISVIEPDYNILSEQQN